MQYSLFIELLRRGHDTEKSMFYYSSRNDKEVDFVLTSICLGENSTGRVGQHVQSYTPTRLAV